LLNKIIGRSSPAYALSGIDCVAHLVLWRFTGTGLIRCLLTVPGI